jgi:hypothetical protein
MSSSMHSISFIVASSIGCLDDATSMTSSSPWSVFLLRVSPASFELVDLLLLALEAAVANTGKPLLGYGVKIAVIYARIGLWQAITRAFKIYRQCENDILGLVC